MSNNTSAPHANPNPSRPTPNSGSGHAPGQGHASANHSDSHADDHGSGHHIVPASTFYKVFAALICLTFLTVAASRIDMGFFNDIVAFGIATVKAGLVLAIFMHLKYDDMMNRVVIGCAFFFLVVLFFFCEIDQITRVVYHSGL